MESGPTGLSAYVPELPTILVTGRTVDELQLRAAEAIQLYLDAIREERSPTSTLCEIEVDVPA